MIKRLMIPTILALFLWPHAGQGAETFRLTHDRVVYADGKGGKLKRPEGVACREQTIVIADTGNGRLVRYVMNRGEMEGGIEIVIPQAPRPMQVHFSSKGEILVLDGQSRNIVRLDPEGKVLGVLQPQGVPNGSTLMVRAFSLDSEDNVYLLDLFGKRVIVTNLAGAFQREIPLPKKSKAFSDIAIDPRGTVFVLDSVDAVIHAAAKGAQGFSPITTDLRQYVTFPANITLDGHGGLMVVDRNGSGVVMVGLDGSYRGRQLNMGWKEGLLYYPCQLCLTAKEEVLIADRDNNRVQIFRMVR
ncbi:MAG: NHL repeat-containing protein [Pseudomonadota bacterium]